MEAEPVDRREFGRFPASGKAVVIRDHELTGEEITGRLVDVSCGGVAVEVPRPLEVGERVSILVANAVDRRAVRLAGSVRHVVRLDDGGYRLGFCLLTWLNPQDVVVLSLTAMASLVRSEFRSRLSLESAVAE